MSGIERIREALVADIPAMAAVHVACWHENYVGLVDQAAIDARTVEFRIADWTRRLSEPGQISLVWLDDGGAVAGFASAVGFAAPFEGFDSYLALLYLLGSVKRRGVGRELLRVLAGMLVARGCRSMALRVLRANPSRGFYERLGARVSSSSISIDEGLWDDVVYVFDDVGVLL
jgi:GNAT superfamily N-acetyltransferase